MIDEREPRRWSARNSEVPDELRALLGAGRAHAPAAGDVAELRQRLALRLGPEAGLGPQTSLLPAAPTGSTLQLLGRVAAVAGGVGTAALLGLWLSSTPPSAGPSSTSPPAPESAPSVLTAPPSVTAPPVTAPAVEATTAEAAPATASPDSAIDTTPPAAAARTAHTKRAPAAALASSEAELLRRAQAALAERPREALRLTAEHQRRFARPALSEEREVIAIEALRRLGKKSAAEQREAAFERRYRGSVHQGKLRDSAR